MEGKSLQTKKNYRTDKDFLSTLKENASDCLSTVYIELPFEFIPDVISNWRVSKQKISAHPALKGILLEGNFPPDSGLVGHVTNPFVVSTGVSVVNVC